MKRFILIVVLLFTILLNNSCHTTRILAPYDQKVELATKSDQLGFKETQRNWYFLWGLVPFNDPTTEKVVKDNGLTKIRVTTKFTPVDYLISIALGSISIVTNTTVVEGEAKKKASTKPSLFDDQP